MSDDGAVAYEIDGGVATILLDRPAKQNSLTPTMLSDLALAVSEADRSPDCRVLLLRGAGERAFCSGADLSAFAGQTRDSTWQQWVPNGHRVFDHLAALRMPTVAVLSGNALGGGLELALACDLRIAATTVKLGLPEVGLGTLPGWGGTHRLVAAVGLTRARQMILTGAPITAEMAERWGLISAHAAPDDVEALVSSFVDTLCSRAPVAQGLAKAVLRAVGDHGHNDVLEALAGALSATTEDLAEGISAFHDKRQSDFQGQ